MDWGFWNSIGITAMAVLGLWVLRREADRMRGKDRN